MPNQVSKEKVNKLFADFTFLEFAPCVLVCYETPLISDILGDNLFFRYPMLIATMFVVKRDISHYICRNYPQMEHP